jgi:nicotinamidase/pyrazinamidase
MGERTSERNIVFWDVDTQFDFMTPPERGGKLYVKDLKDENDEGAIRVAPALRRLSDYAREHGILRVATGDWHTLEHPEIDVEAPDFQMTYPPHCMADEQGSEKIPETELRDPITVPLEASAAEARDAVRAAREQGRDIFVRKREFSCFTGNPATETLLQELNADAYVVYGVALDVCVRHAVEGMLERGKTVYVVDDATWGLGLEDKETLLARWEEQGAKRTTTERVVEHFPPAL